MKEEINKKFKGLQVMPQLLEALSFENAVTDADMDSICTAYCMEAPEGLERELVWEILSGTKFLGSDELVDNIKYYVYFKQFTFESDSDDPEPFALVTNFKDVMDYILQEEED